MDVIRKLALEKPPKLEEAVPSAPAELCAIYMRLVAREAKDRPATAHDVAEELRKLVPQGRDEAARALQKLLELHFGAQAAEQRLRLTTSLEEVAPDQADELRQSVLPESSPSGARARPSTASIADATGANPVSEVTARSAGVDGATREGSRGVMTWAVVAVIAIGGVVVWKIAGGGSESNKGVTSVPSATPSFTTTIATTFPSTTTSTAAASATTVNPTPTPSTRPAPTASLPRPTPAQSITAPRPSASAGPPPRPTSSAAKPPPDVDDHPF
jgi:hypothetical protein